MHYSPQVSLLQCQICFFLFFFCLYRVWLFDRFDSLVFWRWQNLQSFFRRTMILIYLTGILFHFILFGADWSSFLFKKKDFWPWNSIYFFFWSIDWLSWLTPHLRITHVWSFGWSVGLNQGEYSETWMISFPRNWRSRWWWFFWGGWCSARITFWFTSTKSDFFRWAWVVLPFPTSCGPKINNRGSNLRFICTRLHGVVMVSDKISHLQSLHLLISSSLLTWLWFIILQS